MGNLVLILCREMTSDVEKLHLELQNRGIASLAAQPAEIMVDILGTEPRFIYKEQSLEIACVFGWVSLSQREYGMWLLKAFEISGIPVINKSEVLETGQNKFLNSIVMAMNGIPSIPTVLAGNADDIESAAHKIGFPLVIKPIVGAKGQYVCRVDDMNALRNIAPFYLHNNRPLYLQAYIEKPDRDIRVRVIDYRAVYAFFRYTDKHGFLTNLSTGGTWEECALAPKLAELAEKCAGVFHTPVAGVDIVEDRKGNYLVIEVNTTPAITWPHDETVQHVVHYIQQFLLCMGVPQ